MKAIILIRTDHIEQHPLWMQEIATPNPLAVDGIVGCYPMEESEVGQIKRINDAAHTTL
jgi:hypothetical protein